LQLIKQLSVSYFVKGESFMFKRYFILILFTSLFSISSEVHAQGQGQSGDCDDNIPGPPCAPSSPIGGGAGVAILVAAGVALGIKKLKD